MRLHVLLPEDSYGRLLVAAKARHELVRVGFARDLARALEAGGVEGCVIDPTGRRASVVGLLLSMLKAQDCPVLIYAGINKGNVADVLQLQQCCDAQLLLRGFDDQPELLKAALDQLGTSSPSPLVLRDLAPALLRLPGDLCATCIELFGGGSIPRSVHEFFQRARVDERTGSRWINRAGIVSAKRILASARVVRTWDIIGSGSPNLARIAERVGLETERSLSASYHELCGLPRRRARKELTTAMFAERIVASLRQERL